MLTKLKIKIVLKKLEPRKKIEIYDWLILYTHFYLFIYLDVLS
jgi:hypothetical protein